MVSITTSDPPHPHIIPASPTASHPSHRPMGGSNVFLEVPILLTRSYLPLPPPHSPQEGGSKKTPCSKLSYWSIHEYWYQHSMIPDSYWFRQMRIWTGIQNGHCIRIHQVGWQRERWRFEYPLRRIKRTQRLTVINNQTSPLNSIPLLSHISHTEKRVYANKALSK